MTGIGLFACGVVFPADMVARVDERDLLAVLARVCGPSRKVLRILKLPDAGAIGMSPVTRLYAEISFADVDALTPRGRAELDFTLTWALGAAIAVALAMAHGYAWPTLWPTAADVPPFVWTGADAPSVTYRPDGGHRAE